MRVLRVEYQKRWRKRNKRKCRAYATKWRLANVDKQRLAVKKCRQRLRKWLWEFKNKPCKDCDILYIPPVMEFDHVRGIKLSDIGAMVAQGYCKEVIIEEINKCELVCANCHRTRTKIRSIECRSDRGGCLQNIS